MNLNNIDSFYKSTKFENNIENTVLDKNKNTDESTIKEANVKIIDLSKELEPENIYRDIKCRKSAKFIIETTLCIHPVEKCIYLSVSIWNTGVFERHIVCKLINMI